MTLVEVERWYTLRYVCLYTCVNLFSLGCKWSDPPLVKEQNNKSGKDFLIHIDESPVLWWISLPTFTDISKVASKVVNCLDRDPTFSITCKYLWGMIMLAGERRTWGFWVQAWLDRVIQSMTLSELAWLWAQVAKGMGVTDSLSLAHGNPVILLASLAFLGLTYVLPPQPAPCLLL